MRYPALLSVLLLMLICACTGTEKKENVTAGPQEAYHADNDIAMTVRSLTDAIKVGETLDSLHYDFEGILTDGQGHPLYTDIQGNPGEWVVEVSGPASAVIRNLYLGDLLPDDLRSYIIASLNLTDSDIIHVSHDDGNVDLYVYALPGAHLRFETRPAIASNGLEGPLMRIVATGDTTLTML